MKFIIIRKTIAALIVIIVITVSIKMVSTELNKISNLLNQKK